MVNNDVGNATGPVLGISNGGPVGVAVDKEVGAGVGDAVGVKVSRNVGNASTAIGTVNLKTENMEEGMVLRLFVIVCLLGKAVRKNTFFLPSSTSFLPRHPLLLPW